MGIYRNTASYLHTMKPELNLPEKPSEEEFASSQEEIRIPRRCKTIEEIKTFVFLSVHKETFPNQVAKALGVSIKETRRILKKMHIKGVVLFKNNGLVSLRSEIIEEYLMKDESK